MSEHIIETEISNGALFIPYQSKLSEAVREEIVRCRDCKHYEYWKFRDGRIARDCARGGDYLFDTEPNGYCKWGERREDG